MTANNKKIIFIIAAILVVGIFWHYTRKSIPETKTISTPQQSQNSSVEAEPIANNSAADDQSELDPGGDTISAAAQNQPSGKNSPSNQTLPKKYLLQIPFYSQAPLSKWDATHENTCEEASILNAGLYLLEKKLTLAEFDQEMLKMIDIEKKLSINFSDSTIAETKQFSDTYFAGKLHSKIINNPTVNDIETEVAAGNPVIVPLSGRDIGNSNFTPPGPVYHMLVIKGYDSQNFITNDVGTRKGNSYTYSQDVIMENIHDWNATDIHLGASKALILFKS